VYRVDQLAGYLLQLFIFKIENMAAELFSPPQNHCFGFAKSSVHFWQLERGALVGVTPPPIVELNPMSAPRSHVASITNF
jgi:hypothetical protein